MYVESVFFDTKSYIVTVKKQMSEKIGINAVKIVEIVCVFISW